MKCDAVISDVTCALHANANLGMRRLNLWTSLFKRVINERALESAEDYRASKISQTHRDGMKSEWNGNERMSLSASDQRCKLMMPCSSFNEAIQRSVKMAESKKPCRNGCTHDTNTATALFIGSQHSVGRSRGQTTRLSGEALFPNTQPDLIDNAAPPGGCCDSSLTKWSATIIAIEKRDTEGEDVFPGPDSTLEPPEPRIVEPHLPSNFWLASRNSL